jgi:predicted transcriptional regulator
MAKLTKAERDMEEVQAAASRVLQHVIQATEGPAKAETKLDTRNAAAVALGRLGASKGGKARAQSLSKARLKKIASEAARIRWQHTTRNKT